MQKIIQNDDHLLRELFMHQDVADYARYAGLKSHFPLAFSVLTTTSRMD